MVGAGVVGAGVVGAGMVGAGVVGAGVVGAGVVGAGVVGAAGSDNGAPPPYLAVPCLLVFRRSLSANLASRHSSGRMAPTRPGGGGQDRVQAAVTRRLPLPHESNSGGGGRGELTSHMSSTPASVAGGVSHCLACRPSCLRACLRQPSPNAGTVGPVASPPPPHHPAPPSPSPCCTALHCRRAFTSWVFPRPCPSFLTDATGFAPPPPVPRCSAVPQDLQLLGVPPPLGGLGPPLRVPGLLPGLPGPLPLRLQQVDPRGHLLHAG